MENVLKYHNYKEFLNNYVNSSTAARGLRTELAKAMGCQAAYLTQVLAEKAELTEDHAYRLARHLNLPRVEFEYLILLVRLARARTQDLRVFLEGERQAILTQTNEVGSRLDSSQPKDIAFIEKYFSNWIASTIHLATSSEKYQTVEALCARLSLPKKVVLETLDFLEDYKMVQRQGSRWSFAGGPLHLDRTTQTSRSFQVHRRLQTIKALQQDDGSENLHFSSVFTLDKETFDELRAAFLDIIEKAHKKIHAGGTDELYAMTIDMFEVV